MIVVVGRLTGEASFSVDHFLVGALGGSTAVMAGRIEECHERKAVLAEITGIVQLEDVGEVVVHTAQGASRPGGSSLVMPWSRGS